MVGQALVVRPEYGQVLEGAGAWLQPTNGSPEPAGFTPVEVDPYAPMFWREETAMTVRSGAHVELKVVGAGAFATVQKFVDLVYGVTLARKRLKPDVDERERRRFRQEFELMKELKFPYILEVYKFDENDGSFKFVSRRNNQAGFSLASRKRIALPLRAELCPSRARSVQGLRCRQRHLLRRVCPAVPLHRPEEHQRDFAGIHIIARCVDHEPARRYQSVLEVIADVEVLDAPVPVPDHSSGDRAASLPSAVAKMFDLVNGAAARETPA